MFQNKENTPLSALGEFGLIDHLTQGIELKKNSTLKGIGDDAAVLAAGEDALVLTTDMLVEGIHFDKVYTPWKHLGYKSVVVNISDVCAMNAKPEQITISIAVSSRYSLEAIEELYSGMRLAADKYGVDIVGGDTTSSQSGLVISITAIGRTKPEKIVYRSGAQLNNVLVVSGDLGSAYMGLQILEREKAVFQSAKGVQPDLEGNDYVLERQLKPEARTDVIKLLEALGVQPTAMIDVSDGLASEALHLCKASKLGCQIYEERIPIDPDTDRLAREFNLDPTTCALNGGEDYELLFTITPEDWDKLKGNPHFTAIGFMTDQASGSMLISRSNTQHPLKAQGWDSFVK